MTDYLGWPISLEGRWSPRQAQKVLEALRGFAEANGLTLVTVDVTRHGDPSRRLLIVPQRKYQYRKRDD
jgi:nucleotide-binding universal stress UspA family protein